MKIGIYKGGMFQEGQGEILSCCLCGEREYKQLLVQRIGLAIGMTGEEYSFCVTCWQGKHLGQRLLTLLGYPKGLRLLRTAVTVRELPHAP